MIDTPSLLALMLLGAWQCSITLFPGFFNPLPADEASGLSFDTLMAYVAAAAAVGTDKETLPYFVPCALKEAPLTPRMQARTGQTFGKQRSSAHVTESTLIVTDVDGLEASAFEALLDKLRAAGLSFVAYSTHSHGRKDKPGIRARLLVPVNRPLNAAQYEPAWLGFDQYFCDGAIAQADASGRHLWQQQGVWAAHPDRVEQAFRIIHKAGVASADALIACAPKAPLRETATYTPEPIPATMAAQRLAAALPWIDADTTATWITAITAFKALAPVLGDHVAQTLAVRYSEQGSEAAKAHNDDRRFNPAEFFDNSRPTMPPQAALGTLYALAKAGAMVVLNAERGKPALSERGYQAAVYLARHHRRAFAEMQEAAA